MSEPLKWSCSCGKVQGECVAGRGSRLVCYCESCRAFVENQGAGDILDAAGGNDLYQTAPEAFHFTQGTDLLAWTKLTEKGASALVHHLLQHASRQHTGQSCGAVRVASNSFF